LNQARSSVAKVHHIFNTEYIDNWDQRYPFFHPARYFVHDQRAQECTLLTPAIIISAGDVLTSANCFDSNDNLSVSPDIIPSLPRDNLNADRIQSNFGTLPFPNFAGSSPTFALTSYSLDSDSFFLASANLVSADKNLAWKITTVHYDHGCTSFDPGGPSRQLQPILCTVSVVRDVFFLRSSPDPGILHLDTPRLEMTIFYYRALGHPNLAIILAMAPSTSLYHCSKELTAASMNQYFHQCCPYSLGYFAVSHDISSLAAEYSLFPGSTVHFDSPNLLQKKQSL